MMLWLVDRIRLGKKSFAVQNKMIQVCWGFWRKTVFTEKNIKRTSEKFRISRKNSNFRVAQLVPKWYHDFQLWHWLNGDNAAALYSLKFEKKKHANIRICEADKRRFRWIADQSDSVSHKIWYRFCICKTNTQRENNLFRDIAAKTRWESLELNVKNMIIRIYLIAFICRICECVIFNEIIHVRLWHLIE